MNYDEYKLIDIYIYLYIQHLLILANLFAVF